MSRQDVENAKPWREALLQELATKLGYSQVILIGYAQECGTVIDTWGKDEERKALADEWVNQILEG